MPLESATRAVELILSFCEGDGERHFGNTIIFQHSQHGAVPLLVELLQEPSCLLLLIHLRCAGGFPTTQEGVELFLEEGDLLSRPLFNINKHLQEVDR